MEGVYVLLGLVVIIEVALIFFLGNRWKQFVEEIKANESSQALWLAMQNQNKFEEARRRLDKFNFKLEQIGTQPELPFSGGKKGIEK